MRLVGHVALKKEKRNAVTNLVSKSHEKNTLVGHAGVGLWEDKSHVYHRETGI
jgi:hypothetical protein